MKKMALDTIDIRILSALQEYGRVSKSKLAELVNLSPTPCWVRLNKLEKAGLIMAYRAQIDIGRIVDLTKVTVTVALKKHQKSDFDRFESYIQNIDEIVECYATGGGSDYIMTIIARNLADFQDLIEQLLNDEIGIDRYFIYIITRQVKCTTPNLFKLLPA
ncbi:MAG: Lrp/AsnC family transcriptional regulator [Gammaproteobacteria bacterium]|jgi:Lrp/AsnC family transcriptional regulator of ectoine degradation|nr:Lrp/AsnC family transcriptional regulator [Gammaproteobacteria bacterium]